VLGEWRKVVADLRSFRDKCSVPARIFALALLFFGMNCSTRAESQPVVRVRIYQLFVRLFGNTNETRKPNGRIDENGVGKFADINDAALASLAEMGFTHLWLTGVLQQATATDYSEIGQPADDPDLLKGLAGSPYAIKDYFDVCPDYAQKPAERLEEFKALLRRIHLHNLKAMIDLVPNHVARSYGSDIMPDQDFGAKGRGGEGDDRTKFFDPDNNFFYLNGTPPLHLPTCHDGEPISPTCKVLGNKCDGLFDGEKDHGKVTGNNVVSWSPSINDWYETVKLNYGFDFTKGVSGKKVPTSASADGAVPDTWKKMDRILEYWQSMGVDGFRCDMAHMIPCEFWKWAIEKSRARQPGVFFMAEAYDDDPAKIPGAANVMDGLIEAGFDSVYDDPSYKAVKKIYDGPGWANDIDRTLGDGARFAKSMRYAENHDEVRLAGKGHWGNIGMNVGRAAAGILFGLSRGPVMIYNGQEVGEPGDGAEGFGGNDARTSIFDYWSMPELVKWVDGHKFDGGNLSEPQRKLRAWYGKLLQLVGEPAFAAGDFFSLNADNANTAGFGNIEGDPSSGHWMYAYLRRDSASGQRFLVVVNLHSVTTFSQIHIHLSKAARDFIGIPPATDHGKKKVLRLVDRLNGGPALKIAGSEISTRGLEIPSIPPLTACYFELSEE
jgi:glycosidase